MKSIDELTKYFGFYKSNAELQSVLDKILIAPANYDNQTLYIVCRKSNLEIGFTNERMIRGTDNDKPIMGGRPIFTHFNIYPSSFNLFDNFLFGISFSDKFEGIRQKAGSPTRSVDENIPIIGWKKLDSYDFEQIRITFNYNPIDNSVQSIQIVQKEKKIIETSNG
jgi:hypothetical protein